MRSWCRLCTALSTCLVLWDCRCNPPSITVCDQARYFVAPDFSLVEGEVPRPPGRLGRSIPGGAIYTAPIGLHFKDPTHAVIDWVNVDMVTNEPVLFSPGEQVARSESQPGVVYWMSRLTTGTADSVRIGFMSRVCEDPEAIERDKYCWDFEPERRPFVVELACKESPSRR